MLVGCDSTAGTGYLLTALAFGLSVVAMAYSVGNISGGHFNAAVTVVMLIRKSISKKDAIYYMVFQCAGAFLAALMLALIFGAGSVTDMTGALGSNGLAGVGGSAVAGLLVEIILTFIFLMDRPAQAGIPGLIFIGDLRGAVCRTVIYEKDFYKITSGQRSIYRMFHIFF